MRFFAFCSLLLLSTLAVADSQRFDIPSQPLAAALKTFADQAKMQLLYRSDAVSAGTSNAVIGDFGKREALQRMLRGTGFEVVFSNDNAATVRPLRGASKPTSSRVSSEHLHVAQVYGDSAARLSGTLEEVVVTATKREENVRRVAGSVSAVTGAQLHEIGAQGFADYLTRTPGVVFNASIPGYSTVTIRGISTTNSIDQGQGTTGIYIDDVSLTDPYVSVGIPDIDPFDVERVEVLRGRKERCSAPLRSAARSTTSRQSRI